MSTFYPAGSNSASDSSEISNQLNTGSFDIRDHLDKLQPGNGKDKYICPVCGGRNLSVEGKTPAYRCFTSDCAPAAIREAIKPWTEVLAERQGQKEEKTKQKPQKKVVAVKCVSKQSVKVPVPAGLKLLRLPAPQYGPKPHKPEYFPEKVPVDALQITYRYSDSQFALRWEWLDPDSPKGRDKTYRQTHIADDGKRVATKGTLPWSAYRIDEVVEVLTDIPDGEPVAVLMLEGEPNVELARSHGIAALTLQGSNWNDAEITKAVEALRANGENVALVKLRDNDATGIKKGNQVQAICDRLQFPCIVIDPVAICPDIPDKGDIREILENMDIEEFIRRLETEIHNAAMEEIQENPLLSRPHTCEDVVRLSFGSNIGDYIPDTAPVSEENYILKAESALYSEGHWVSIAGQIYRFTGSYSHFK